MPQGRTQVLKKGCNTCRTSKVKCDETRPECSRCAKLSRSCTWPVAEPSLSIRRHGAGTWDSRARAGTLSLAPLLPNNAVAEPLESPSESDTTNGVLEITHVGSIMDPSSTFGGPWVDTGYEYQEPAWQMPQNVENGFIPAMESPLMGYANFSSFDFLSVPENLQPYFATQWSSLPSQRASPIRRDSTPTYWSSPSPPLSFISDHYMALPNCLILSSKEHHALGHYQTTFSIYRTTKDPKWGTHKLLLDLGAKSTMIMHFILAVAINDVCHRQEYETSPDAQQHFEIGAQALIEMVQKASEDDFIMVMAGFLFLYWYMPKRKSVPRERIQQLSMTVLTYLKKNKLDSRCLESESEGPSDESPLGLTDRERPILARLIIWIFDEDVKCGFQGFGGYFAKYLTAHRERTMAVYEVSRTVLEAHWGTTYPKEQIDDDDYNAMELEFLWVLTALWQDINDLSQTQSSSRTEAHRRIEQRFNMLEKKYSSVFQKSATMTQPRDRVLINADYDIVLFHSLKVYYFRANISDSNTTEIPPDVEAALKSMLDIIQRTFASKSSDLHDRLQWPLFLAGIETEDGIYRNWIVSNITSRRAREALQKTIDHQSCSGKRLAMSVIKALLCESDSGPSHAPSLDQGSFLDSFVESGF